VNGKKLAGAGVAAVGAATAAAALLFGSTAAVADEAGPDSSAYGISASGLITVDPIPYVESRDGKPAHDELLKLAPADDLSVGVLTVDAKPGAATASVARVNVLGLLKADLVTTSCKGGDGALEIIKGSVLGTKLPENPIAGQKIDVSPLLTVTLGDQTRNPDGSLTVTGIELTVLPGRDDPKAPLTSDEKAALPGLDKLGLPVPADASTVGDVLGGLTGTLTGGRAVQTVTIGSATCGWYDEHGDGPAGDDHGDDAGPSAPAPEPAATPEAPKPEIVKADLPVTG
jgi:hypothetical protein